MSKSANATISAAGFICAVTSNDTVIAKRFLQEQKVDPDAPGPDGTTALCAAVMWDCNDMVQLILDSNGDPNALCEGTAWSPLHAAAFKEDVALTELLLGAGAEPDLEDLAGRTPTDYASASASSVLWDLFQARGCERSSKAELIDKGIISKVVDPAAAEASDVPAAKQAVDPAVPRPLKHESRTPASPSSMHSPAPGQPLLDLYSRPGSAYVKSSPGGMGMPKPPSRRVRKINGVVVPEGRSSSRMMMLPEEP